MKLQHLLFAFTIALGASTASRAEVAELDEAKLASSYEFQQTPVWCWAASIHIALKYRGIDIGQPRIVEKTFGRVVSRTGNFLEISNNLNYRFSEGGKTYLISASLLPVNNVQNTGNPWAITPEAMVNHLKLGRPIIVAYQSSMFSGHAVVLTGVSYRFDRNNRVEIQSFTVRDPYPYSPEHVQRGGKKTFNQGAFPGPIQGVWLVDISET